MENFREKCREYEIFVGFVENRADQWLSVVKLENESFDQIDYISNDELNVITKYYEYGEPSSHTFRKIPVNLFEMSNEEFQQWILDEKIKIEKEKANKERERQLKAEKSKKDKIFQLQSELDQLKREVYATSGNKI